ncbi:segregation/condensation protein A [uncultured Fibrobacter sp.]|uniref:segregation/condensation protein A n=1 Tax=uncultured Fibrobacter sp. TaxID=261512 RepID=UPI0025F26429|nr:segregation/condensation protein A [uncultured Fibrobacter sp.]
MQEVEEQEDYEVNIGSFNGPMDLLVYLVQKKEMSLDQIPIAEIADDFLAWVNKIGVADLSKAGDFLYMASRLMALKVQELLPAEERDPELVEEYNEDREKLMQEMLEYQRYKQVAGGLQDMEGQNFGTYSRGRLEKTQNEEDTLADANIWQLFRAYQKSLKTKISETVHHIELDYVTIQDRQQAINNYLNVNGRALFEDLLDNDSHPIVAAVTFMALLEMIKTDEVVFRQSELFGPIWIYRKKNNPEYADEMARETVFFSKDPDVKPGLVEVIRNQALARSQAGSVGDIAAVMKEAVLWTTRGRNVTDEDLQAMLEGREDLSEVQDDPFTDMLREEGAVPPAENATAETPAAEKPAVSSDVPAFNEQPVESAPVESATPVEETPVESATSAIETPADEPSSEKPAAGSPADTSQMSDEEFEAFMKKAQAYYSEDAANKTAAEESANENIAEESGDDEDEGPTVYGADEN